MKAKTVHENLEFKRGIPSKESLKVGRKYSGIKNPTVEDLRDLGPGDYIVSSWSVDGMMFYTKIRIMNRVYLKYPENLWSDDPSFFQVQDIKWENEGNLINAEYAEFLKEWNIKFIISADSDQIIKENIRFKRGMEPKDSLEIGIGRKIDDIDNPKEGYYLAYRSESKYKDQWKRSERPDNVFCILEAKRNHADNLLIYRISNWSIEEEGPFYLLQSYSRIIPPSDYDVDWLRPIYHIRISEWDEFKDFKLKRDGKEEIYGSTLIMGDIKLYENIDFKRGIEPKDALGIGDPLKLIEEGDTIYYKNFTGIEKEFWGMKGVVREVQIKNLYVTDSLSAIPKENIYKIVKKDGTQIKINENLDFQRGLEPKKALGLGYLQRLASYINKELKWNENHPVYEVRIYSQSLRYLKKLIEAGKAYGESPGTDGLNWLEYYEEDIDFLENKYGKL